MPNHTLDKTDTIVATGRGIRLLNNKVSANSRGPKLKGKIVVNIVATTPLNIHIPITSTIDWNGTGYKIQTIQYNITPPLIQFKI